MESHKYGSNMSSVPWWIWASIARRVRCCNVWIYHKCLLVQDNSKTPITVLRYKATRTSLQTIPYSRLISLSSRELCEIELRNMRESTSIQPGPVVTHLNGLVTLITIRLELLIER